MAEDALKVLIQRIIRLKKRGCRSGKANGKSWVSSDSSVGHFHSRSQAWVGVMSTDKTYKIDGLAQAIRTIWLRASVPY